MSSKIPDEGDGKNGRKYNMDFKRQVINFYHAHAGNISLAAKMFGVDRKLVRSWVEQEDFFRRNTTTDWQQEPEAQTAEPVIAIAPQKISVQAASATGKQNSHVSVLMAAPTRVLAARRPEKPLPTSVARYPELEKELTTWWTAQHNRGHTLKVKDVKTKALQLYSQLYPHSNDQEFKASTGWLQRFQTRMENITAQPMMLQHQSRNQKTFAESTEDFRGSSSSRPIRPAPPPIRVAPYHVPETAKYNAAATYDIAPIVEKGRRGSQDSVSTIDLDESLDSSISYTSMTAQDRQQMDRQLHEANRFFQDVREFLTFLENVTR